jgi:hypothetical protein
MADTKPSRYHHWETIAVAPTSGLWFNVSRNPDGTPHAEPAPAILTQECTTVDVLNGDNDYRIDCTRQTRAVFATAVSGNVIAVSDWFERDEYIGTVHESQLEETLDAIRSEATGGNGQHEGAAAALARVRAAARRGDLPAETDVVSALACSCHRCLAGNVDLAAELVDLGVLSITVPTPAAAR